MSNEPLLSIDAEKFEQAQEAAKQKDLPPLDEIRRSLFGREAWEERFTFTYEEIDD